MRRGERPREMSLLILYGHNSMPYVYIYEL